MIEYVVVAQLLKEQPQQQQPTQSTYQAPKYQTPSTTQSGSVPSSKQIEEFEEKLFEHPNG